MLPMIRTLIAFAVFLLPVAAMARDTAATPPLAAQLEGTWDFRIDGTTIFRYTLEKDASDKNWHGTWQRPMKFRTNGNAFGDMTGGVRTLHSTAGYRFMGAVELSFADPRPGAVPDVFHFVPKGRNEVQMTYEGTDLAPYTLVRASPADPIGNWDPNRIYSREKPVPAAASGADRRSAPPEPEDKKVTDNGQTVQIVTLPPGWRLPGKAPAQLRRIAPAPASSPKALTPPVKSAAKVPDKAAPKAAKTPQPEKKPAGKKKSKKKWPPITKHFLDGF